VSKRAQCSREIHRSSTEGIHRSFQERQDMLDGLRGGCLSIPGAATPRAPSKAASAIVSRTCFRERSGFFLNLRVFTTTAESTMIVLLPCRSFRVPTGRTGRKRCWMSLGSA
jgi:hypothetical protein